jgi:hypothetical protein
MDSSSLLKPAPLTGSGHPGEIQPFPHLGDMDVPFGEYQRGRDESSGKIVVAVTHLEGRDDGRPACSASKRSHSYPPTARANIRYCRSASVPETGNRIHEQGLQSVQGVGRVYRLVATGC